MKPLPTKDVYQEAYEKYIDTPFTEALEKEHEIQPYHIRYRILYYVALAFTYLFNFFSFSTGAILVYFFLVGFLYSWIAASITGALAILIEIAKRKTVDNWAKQFFVVGRWSLDLLIVILLLSALSITGSYYGTDKGINELTPDFENIAADTLKEVRLLNIQIAELRTEKKALEGQKNSQGKTYYKVLPSINRISEQIAALDEEVLDRIS